MGPAVSISQPFEIFFKQMELRQSISYQNAFKILVEFFRMAVVLCFVYDMPEP